MKLSAPPLIPSYGQGFNRFVSEPLLEGLWCPSLGPTGAVLYDQGPYKCHGTLTAMVPATDWVSSTRWGWVLDYDGVNDQVVIPYKGNLAIGLSDFTILGWIRLNGPTAVRHPNFISNGPAGAGEWFWRVSDADALNQANRRLMFYADIGGTLVQGANGSWPFDTWVHVAVTRRGALAVLYQNGIPIAEDATAGDDLNSGTDWTIGGSIGVFWKGPIGNISYFRRWMPQNEILQHMADPHLLLREAA